MKLIKCPKCSDLIALRPWRKSCKCGLCYGMYLGNGSKVMVSRESLVFGMPNNELFEIPRGDSSVVYRDFG